jgi:hypothetical protein
MRYLKVSSNNSELDKNQTDHIKLKEITVRTPVRSVTINFPKKSIKSQDSNSKRVRLNPKDKQICLVKDN